MRPEDFLCDFCARAWDGTRPMVEGHKGSLICGDCLSAAYASVVLQKQHAQPAPDACTLCLEHRAQAHWRGSTEEAAACERCLRQAAQTLSKDPDAGWVRPV